MKKEAVIKFYLRYKLYIFPAIVALSSLFLIIFAIYPQTVKLIDNQKIAGDLTNKSNFLETKALALESYDEKDLSQKVGVALNAFPTDKDYGNILGLLQGLTAQFGFTISAITVSTTSGKLENASSFEMKLEIRGPKALFQNLLANLESSPRIMRVKGIDVSSLQASEALGATIAVEVLYASIPQSFGLVDSPLPSLSQKDEELLAALSRTALTASSSAAQPSQRGKANPFE